MVDANMSEVRLDVAAHHSSERRQSAKSARSRRAQATAVATNVAIAKASQKTKIIVNRIDHSMLAP